MTIGEGNDLFTLARVLGKVSESRRTAKAR